MKTLILYTRKFLYDTHFREKGICITISIFKPLFVLLCLLVAKSSFNNSMLAKIMIV